MAESTSTQRQESSALWNLLGLGLLALWIMMPVTLPVPVLREVVAERFEVSELATSLFMSINMVGALFTAPLAGMLADRWGRRRPLLAGALVLDALCFFALAAPVSFPVFLAIRFFEGVAHISALSVLLTLASHAVPDAQRGRAMGVVGGSMMLGIALGAPLGGLLGRSDVLLPLQLGGVLALASAGLAMLVVREARVHDEKPSLGDIARALRAHPSLFAPLAFAFVDRFTVGFFTTTFSLYVRRIYDLSSAEIGMAIAIFMIPFALFSYLFGRVAERFSITLLLCVGSVLYGFGTAAVGFTAPPALYGLMFATGVVASVMFVPSMVMTTQAAPPHIRATALGAFNAAGSLGFILGPLCGGAISQAVATHVDWLAGYRAAFLVAGISEFLCVAIALPFLLRLRREGRVT